MKAWMSTLIAVAIAAATVPALASPAGTDRDHAASAQAALDAATDEFAHGHAEEARRRLAALYASTPSTTVLWNLALAEEATSHLVDAERHFRVCAADPAAKESIRSRAAKKLETVRAVLGRIEVRAPLGKQVFVDDQPVEEQDWANGIYVLPGTHPVRVGTETAKLATVAAGRVQTIWLDEPHTTAAPATTGPRQAPMSALPPTAAPQPKAPSNVAPAPSPAPRSTSSAKPWIVGGAGLVAAGLAAGAIGTYVAAANDLGQVQADRLSASGCPNGSGCPALAHAERVHNQNLYWSYGLTAGAAVTAVGGALLWLTWHPEGSSKHGFVPVVSPTYVGGTYEVRF